MINILKNQKFNNKKNIFKSIFSLYFLLGMHVYLKHAGVAGLYVPYNIFGWITVSILIGISFWYTIDNKKLIFSKFQIISWMVFFLLLIPMYYPNNELAYLATYRLLFIAGGIILYGAFLQMKFNEEDKNQLLLLILIAALMQSFIGLAQYFGFFKDSIELFADNMLPFGTFQQKSVMATFQVSGIVISLFFMSKKSRLFNSKKYILFLLLIPFFSSFLVILIKSDLGIICLFLAVFFQLFIIDIRDQKIKLWFFSLLLGLLVGFNFPANDIDYSNKRTSIDQLDYQNQVRDTDLGILNYSSSWKIFLENKIIGVGYGKFTRSLRSYLAKNRAESDANIIKLDKYIAYPYNELLLWICEGGIIAIVALVISLFSLLTLIFRNKRSDIFLCLSLLSPILINMAFDLPFFISFPHWIIFLFLIYFFDKGDYRYTIKSPIVFLLPMVVLPLMVIYNMLIVFHNSRLLTNYEFISLDQNVSNYEILSKISNPGPLHLFYNYEQIKSMLELGLATKNNNLLEIVVDKAKRFAQHSPIIGIYEIRHEALKALGKNIHAVAVQYNARYFYPDPFPGADWLSKTSNKKNLEKIKIKNEERLKISESFLFENIKANPNIIETESGLQYRVIKNGYGDYPIKSNRVLVHYIGRFIDGLEFDSSKKDGHPIEFKLDEVIGGWQEGLQLMKEGSVFELFIHPKLGYGEKGNRFIPGNSCLIFEVELIKILD